MKQIFACYAFIIKTNSEKMISGQVLLHKFLQYYYNVKFDLANNVT